MAGRTSLLSASSGAAYKRILDALDTLRPGWQEAFDSDPSKVVSHLLTSARAVDPEASKVEQFDAIYMAIGECDIDTTDPLAAIAELRESHELLADLLVVLGAETMPRVRAEQRAAIVARCKGIAEDAHALTFVGDRPVDSVTGVISMLDAAIASATVQPHDDVLRLLRVARDSLAVKFGVWTVDPLGLAQFVQETEQISSRDLIDGTPRSRVDLMAADLASRHNSPRGAAVLVATLIRESELLPGHLADETISGPSLMAGCTRLAATALAIGQVVSPAAKRAAD